MSKFQATPNMKSTLTADVMRNDPSVVVPDAAAFKSAVSKMSLIEAQQFISHIQKAGYCRLDKKTETVKLTRPVQNVKASAVKTPAPPAKTPVVKAAQPKKNAPTAAVERPVAKADIGSPVVIYPAGAIRLY